MKTHLLPIIFYLSILIYLICLYKNGGLKILFNAKHFDDLKYHLGTSLFFYLNINALFICSISNHSITIFISLTMIAVLIGLVIYLTHLGKQTVNAFRQIILGNEFDLMAPFFSIPYFYLIDDIFGATLNLGFESLHANESKMLIVLLYPFFLVTGELTCKVKNIKGTLEKKQLKHLQPKNPNGQYSSRKLDRVE